MNDNIIKKGAMCLYKGHSLAMVSRILDNDRVMITVLSEDHDTCYEKIANISDITVKQ